jgi:hypothetical protein
METQLLLQALLFVVPVFVFSSVIALLPVQDLFSGAQTHLVAACNELLQFNLCT